MYPRFRNSTTHNSHYSQLLDVRNHPFKDVGTFSRFLIPAPLLPAVCYYYLSANLTNFWPLPLQKNADALKWMVPKFNSIISLFTFQYNFPSTTSRFTVMTCAGLKGILSTIERTATCVQVWFCPMLVHEMYFVSIFNQFPNFGSSCRFDLPYTTSTTTTIWTYASLNKILTATGWKVTCVQVGFCSILVLVEEVYFFSIPNIKKSEFLKLIISFFHYFWCQILRSVAQNVCKKHPYILFQLFCSKINEFERKQSEKNEKIPKT